MQIKTFFTIGFMLFVIVGEVQKVKPLRVGIAGLTHAHV
jgi:hypothetical protein